MLICFITNNTIKMAKSESLRKVEEEMQQLWETSPIFNGVKSDKESYMATFPYPYMNGRLHLGHGLTVSKAEFATQHERHKGKQVLFPFGFHATGMPIVACADKLKRELYDDTTKVDTTKVDTTNVDTTETEIKTQYHSAKSKLSSKSGGSQLETMRKMGISEEEIPMFTKPEYWLKYFIPKCIDDLKGIGAGIDWTRQFTTTDMNQYYDKFVRWQFNKLHQSNKLKFGKRFTIWSPKDNQPCQDHDRSSGEGVKPQEYTLVNFETRPNEQQYKLKEFIKDTLKDSDKDIEKYTINLLTATLRPETMYGLTNLWVHPDLEYGVYFHQYEDIDNIVVVLPRSAKNMSYQGHTMNLITTIKGEQLLGLNVSVDDVSKLYVLPMLQISPNKGTGIVSSVPTESPDDYLNLLVLKNEGHPIHKSMFEKYSQLTSEMVDNNPVPIIRIPDSPYDCQPAIVFCENNNIKNPKSLQGLKLQEAKKEIYTLSKAKGVFMVKPYEGRSVESVLPELMEQKLKECVWFKYAEPESEIMSRSGDVCVVSLTDQWFIDYGELSWKQELENQLENMEMYSEKAKEQFMIAKDWLSQWPCSRTYGLGTKLDVPSEIPIEENTIIDSLSDSTIYMALYTIYPQLTAIPSNLVDDVLFDYVFLDKSLPEGHNHDEKLLDEMRQSFNYWYPMDLRVSGKDLVQNHLTFCLYNHLAIWGNDKTKLPKSFRTNGHITIDGEKMSKSTGNFITLEYIREHYGADALRLSIACASSDPIEDTDYKSETKTSDGVPDLKILNISVLKIHTQLEWMLDVIPKLKLEKYRSTEPNFFDVVFQNQIKGVINCFKKHMDEMVYYEAVQESFYRLIIMRDQYDNFVNGNYHLDTIKFFIETFLIINTPFIPHLTEYCWQKYQNNSDINISRETSIRFQPYPIVDEVDELVMNKYKYIQTIIKTIGVMEKRWCKQTKTSVKDINMIEVKIGNNIELWKKYVINIIKSYMNMNNVELNKINMKDISSILNTNTDLVESGVNYKKKIAPFVARLIKKGTKDDINIESKFDRLELLNMAKPYLETYLEKTIKIISQDDIEPNHPEIVFKSV